MTKSVENIRNNKKETDSFGNIIIYYFCKLQHLTTFTMDRKSAILTVADSVRKLQLLDARGKIWTQEIIMMVDDQAIRLIDYETTVRLKFLVNFTNLCDITLFIW